MLKQVLKIALICTLLMPMASCTSCGGGGGGGGTATYTYYGGGQIGNTVLTLEQTSLGSDHSFIYKDIISGSETTGTYSSTGTSYTFTTDTGSVSGWCHADDTCVSMIPTAEDTLVAGIAVTPETTALVDFMAGNTYGGLYVVTTDRVAYVRWHSIGSDGSFTWCAGRDITAACDDTVFTGNLSSYQHNPTNHNFQYGTDVAYVYANSTLNYLLEWDQGQGFGLFDKDPAATTVPAGIAVGDIFNGYMLQKISGVTTIIEGSLRVDMIGNDRDSITLSVVGTILSAELTPADSANWPGFWMNNATAGQSLVGKFIGDNTITYSNNKTGDDFDYGVFVK